MRREDFINQIAPDVVRACAGTGVFPSVVIAQAIQESGAGTSALARLFRNLFGHIATPSWRGKTGKVATHGKLWRAYDSFSQAIASHVRVLLGNRYRAAGVLDARTPYEQALKLQRAGYNAGSDRNIYANKLANIIKDYNLTRFDNQQNQSFSGFAYFDGMTA